MPPLVAKTVENCINNMYEKLINNPNPKWNPIPPRILREAIHTPINVNINVAKAPENILYFSIWNSTTLLLPRNFCRAIYSSSSGNVKRSLIFLGSSENSAALKFNSVSIVCPVV